MNLAKKIIILNILIIFTFLSLLTLNSTQKKAYASYDDYFTYSATNLSKYEVLINVVTKREMNNFIVNISYLTDAEDVIASDVKKSSHLEANQRYQFVFNMREVMSETDCKDCSQYRYNFTCDEKFVRVTNNTGYDNNNSAFENSLINTFGENYKIILLAIAGGVIVLACICASISKSRK